jgi:hypothetical protein
VYDTLHSCSHMIPHQSPRLSTLCFILTYMDPWVRREPWRICSSSSLPQISVLSDPSSTDSPLFPLPRHGSIPPPEHARLGLNPPVPHSDDDPLPRIRASDDPRRPSTRPNRGVEGDNGGPAELVDAGCGSVPNRRIEPNRGLAAVRGFLTESGGSVFL